MSVIIETSKGDIVVDVYVDECPKAATNFLKCVLPVAAAGMAVCELFMPDSKAHLYPGLCRWRWLQPTCRLAERGVFAALDTPISSPTCPQAVQAQVLQQLPVLQCAAQLHCAERRPHQHRQGRRVGVGRAVRRAGALAVVVGWQVHANTQISVCVHRWFLCLGMHSSGWSACSCLAAVQLAARCQNMKRACRPCRVGTLRTRSGRTSSTSARGCWAWRVRATVWRWRCRLIASGCRLPADAWDILRIGAAACLIDTHCEPIAAQPCRRCGRGHEWLAVLHHHGGEPEQSG